MNKRLFLFCLCVSLTLSLVSCTGYNSIMCDHLSDASNYQQYEATIVNFYYEYEEYELSAEFDSDRIQDAISVRIDVTLQSKSELAAFIGTSPDSLVKECEEYTVRLEIIAENHKILLKNGFYDVAEKGSVVTLTASNWIYMDGDFFYVAGVSYDGTEYLSKKDGLRNIQKMVNDNRSVF